MNKFSRIFIIFSLVFFAINLYAVVTLKEAKKTYTEISSNEDLIGKTCMFGQSVENAYSSVAESSHERVMKFATENAPTEALITCGWHKKGDGVLCYGYETKDPNLHLTVYLKQNSDDPGLVCHVYKDGAACGDEIAF